MQAQYPRLWLRETRDASLRRGHPWVFSGAVARLEGSPAPGACVLAVSPAGEPLGLGFYHPATDIAFRLLTRDATERIDAFFWRKRIARARDLRAKIVPAGTTAYRLVNAEGDGLPGLVADRYGDWLVLSLQAAGMEQQREALLSAFRVEIAPRGILERSEGRSRKTEGMAPRIAVADGIVPETVTIEENGLSFAVDLMTGQKTGFFLDQRPNRELLRRLAQGAVVLNAFAYTGAFSVYAAAGGAARAFAVESSGPAAARAAQNLERNGFSPEGHPVFQADVFSWLRETSERFDLVVLDPPAFAKTRQDVSRAARAYKDVNLQAMKRLREGGLLLTFSCSNAVPEDLFAKIVLGAARDAGKTARLLQALGPGPDHPTDLGHPEGRYLKGLLLALS